MARCVPCVTRMNLTSWNISCLSNYVLQEPENFEGCKLCKLSGFNGTFCTVATQTPILTGGTTLTHENINFRALKTEGNLLNRQSARLPS
jgi:hypothetical protein